HRQASRGRARDLLSPSRKADATPMRDKALALAALLASLLLGMGTGQADPPLPSVDARLGAREVLLARPFELQIDVVHLESTQILWPESLELGSAVEEIDRTLTKHSEGGPIVRSELRVMLQAFDTALRDIGPIEIRYDEGAGAQVLTTPALAIEVRGVIGGE